MHLPISVKYNLSHGFPEHWPTSLLEHDIILPLCEQKQFDLVVNATWGFLECEHPITGETSDKFRVTRDLVLNHGARNILFFNFVDPLYEHSTWYEVLKECQHKIGQDNITTVGFIDTLKFKQDYEFPFWAIQLGDTFQNYEVGQILPVNNINNFFLCYNRKPTLHRVQLHDALERKGLLSKGVFTLGNEDPAKIKMINLDKSTMPYENNNIHGNLNIPNDTHSLGPLEVWNSCFLVIVTETDHNMTTGHPFLSEKIWKPLIGMRPFLCLGDKGTNRYLRDAGFHTFNAFFGCEDDLTVDQMVKVIEDYRGIPADDYEKLRDKLEHNRRHFFSYSKTQRSIALGLKID